MAWRPPPPNATYYLWNFKMFRCSEVETEGQLPLGARVSLLPFHAFPRKVPHRTAHPRAPPFVMHLYAKTNQRSKIHVLTERGLWFLREDWRAVPFGGDRAVWLGRLQRPNISVLYHRPRSGVGSDHVGPRNLGPLGRMGGDGTNIHGR